MMNILMKPSPTTKTVAAEQLRSAMRAWTTGVAIVTAAHGEQQHGMTVSSFSSIALDPPLIAISLQTDSHTRELVSLAGTFGVTILARGQEQLSERFAGHLDADVDRMQGLATETLVTGAPFIQGGLAFLDCRVTQAIGAGGNTLFIGEVLAVRADDHDEPLVYHDRGYRRLQD
jgi:flavin reductase (DIM6/NTAB) family NADH-FMN oxidoreductase RutF